MPSPQKLYITCQAYLVTTRTEEGLPFIPTKTINAMIKSCLGKAAKHYEVRLVAFCFISNHLHIVLIVKSPEAASSFVGYLKQEMSHAVNRMLSRRQKTVWKAEYDTPVLLSGGRCLEQIAYTLANPCASDLAKIPEEYIGVTSIESLKSDTSTILHEPKFRRSYFKKL